MQYKGSKISAFALVLLITGAIDSIRNLPATALFGPSLIFFFIFSAIVFLIPVALVSAELSSTWTDDEGGIYSWVKRAFGEQVAFFAIWLQWINTMVWYPTILSFIAGVLAYLINPALAHNKLYLISVILICFWSLTLLALRGLHVTASFASFCAIVGMIVPMVMIIGLAVVWIAQGHTQHIQVQWSSIMPNLHHTSSWVSLTAIMTAFLGMELATVHVKQVANPKKNFPRALFFSVILILLTMILGSLAIAFVIPQSKISLVDGVMQAFVNFFNAYHLQWMIPIITIMLLLGSLGGMLNWIISPAKGLLVASEHGFLPKFLQHRNKHGVASRLLLGQALLVSLLCGCFSLMPSVNGIYWLFTDLSTQLYMLMYVLMFFAAIRLKYKYPTLERGFAIPGGKLGAWFIVMLGVIGCIITLIVGFIPPQESINVGGAAHFELLFCAGIALMIVPVLFFYQYQKKTRLSCLKPLDKTIR